MNEIDKYISEKNFDEALQECIRSSHNSLGLLISHIATSKGCTIQKILTQQLQTNIDGLKTEMKIIEETKNDDISDNPSLMSDEENDPKIRVKLLTNWTTSAHLRELWNKMSQGNYTWNNIQVVLDDDPDYFVVINAPPKNVDITDPSKTIIFQMEPYMENKNKHIWKEWAKPDPKMFFKVCTHENEYNNNEWHLSKTYTELKNMHVEKDNKLDNIVSTVLSAKYHDPGHIKRVDFAKFMANKGIPVHVFGSNKWEYKDYKGSLPSHQKDDAMFPYKYVFNVENNSIKNYYTEKLIDGILAECLVFYSGCYNIRDFIDPKAYVYLELSNFEEDYQKVKKAIEDNLWEKRIDIIRKEKQKILDHLQFFPRLERIING